MKRMRRGIKLGPRMLLALLLIFGGLYVHASVYGTPKPLFAQVETATAPAVAATWALPVSPVAGEHRRPGSQLRAVTLPEKWSAELGHYLGWLVGDGCISGNVATTVYGTEDEQREILPLLQAKGIGVIGMKSVASGTLATSGVVTAAECRRYALSLPVSTLVCGIDSPKVLEQDLAVARGFTPMSEEERKAMVEKVSAIAKGGKLESYKLP